MCAILAFGILRLLLTRFATFRALRPLEANGRANADLMLHPAINQLRLLFVEMISQFITKILSRDITMCKSMIKDTLH